MSQQRWVMLVAVVLAVAGAVSVGLRALGVIGGCGDWSHLPDQAQQTLAYLLVLPLGALLTAVVRTMVGFQTFGTLTPSLLAASYLYCDRTTGAVVFVLVMVVGLGSRACWVGFDSRWARGWA